MKYLAVIIIGIMLSACASYHETLTNAKGQSVTCEASGHAGIITGFYLKESFRSCIDDARAHGFN